MAGASAWLKKGVNTAWARGSTATPPIRSGPSRSLRHATHGVVGHSSRS
jgi:hypothetical protein